MPQYDIAFATKLAEVAQGVVADGLDSHEARRTVAYLSRLSMELSLKSFLEKAGKPVAEIRSLSHKLRELLREVDQCEVEVEIAPGVPRWMPASRLRSVTIQFHDAVVPVGMVVDGEDFGASTYPNKIRYGEAVEDFPPEVLALVAVKISSWMQDHWEKVRGVLKGGSI